MSNKDWLNDLKVDDKVFVVSKNIRNNITNKNIRTITRITPTKRIIVDNLTFINGEYCSGDKFGSIKIYLDKVTQKSIEEYKQNNFKICVLNKINLLEDITFEQAQQLNDILNLGVKYESIEY